MHFTKIFNAFSFDIYKIFKNKIIDLLSYNFQKQPKIIIKDQVSSLTQPMFRMLFYKLFYIYCWLSIIHCLFIEFSIIDRSDSHRIPSTYFFSQSLHFLLLKKMAYFLRHHPWFGILTNQTVQYLSGKICLKLSVKYFYLIFQIIHRFDLFQCHQFWDWAYSHLQVHKSNLFIHFSFLSNCIQYKKNEAANYEFVFFLDCLNCTF